VGRVRGIESTIRATDFYGVEAPWRPPYNAPPSLSPIRPRGDSAADRLGTPLTTYDFAFARHQALLLVLIQAAIAGVVALLCAALNGGAAALSALVGGGIGAVATLVQVASSFGARAGSDLQAVARGFYRGEALKMAVTVLLFVGALRAHRFAPGAMFGGYVATFVAFWIALARFAGRRAGT